MNPTAFYTPLPDRKQYGCLIPLPNDISAATGNGHTGQSENTVFLCLDISGSMSGTPLNQAKVATLSLIERLRATGIEDIVVVFWDDRVLPYKVSGLTMEKIKDDFGKIRARGGTSFTNCLEWVGDQVVAGTAQKTNTVLFLTDGQDASFMR